MKKGKKLLTLVMVMLFAMAMLLTGCGSSGSSDKTESKKTEETTTEATEKASTEATEKTSTEEASTEATEKAAEKVTIANFVGDWDCDDNSLEDSDTYTGYLALTVKKNGKFSLYDCEAGNPGISGTMTVDSDHEVTVKCTKDDFDPPAGWESMSTKQTLEYEFTADDTFHLIYKDGDKTSTLVFHHYEE